MAALERSLVTLREVRACYMTCSLARTNPEQWVYTLMTLRKKRQQDAHHYYPMPWLHQLAYEAKKEFLAPYLPRTRTAINPTAKMTDKQQNWRKFVEGIKSMYQLSTFGEAASQARRVWEDTNLSIEIHDIFASLPREQKKIPIAPPACDLPSPPAALKLSPIRIPPPTPKRKRSPAQIAWSKYVLTIQKRLQLSTFREACHTAKGLILVHQKMNNQPNYYAAREKIYSIYSATTAPA